MTAGMRRASGIGWSGAWVALVLGTALPLRPAAAQPAEESGEAAGANAAPAAEVSEEQRESARRHYRTGTRQLERNRPEDALEEFARSYQLFPHWATSNSLGVCHDRLRRPTEALRLYEQALREGGDQIPADKRTEIEQRVRDLRVQLGIREVTTGLLRVSSEPPGGAVSLDGAPVGTAPVEVEAAPGAHQVAVELSGYRTGTVEAQVALGETVAVVVALEVEVAAPETGRLLLESDPAGARVVVDGVEVGRTPLTLADALAGPRRVRLELDDGRSWEETVTVAVDDTVEVSVAFGGTVDSGWFWGTAAAAVALGAGALGTGLYGKQNYDDFYGLDCPASPSAQCDDWADSGETMFLLSDLLTGAAGALALTAVVLAFFTDFGAGDAEISGGVAETPPPAAGEPVEAAAAASLAAAFR